MNGVHNDELMTAVMIVLPPHVQAIAQPLIASYAPTLLHRSPPHMTLFLPFLPYSDLDNACDDIREVCRKLNPFSVTLSGYGHFPIASYMAVKDPTDLQRVHSQLLARFPDYPPYDGRFGRRLTPHVTIAYRKDNPGAGPPPLPAYEPLTFVVDRLHVMCGASDMTLPFIPHDVIRLGMD